MNNIIGNVVTNLDKFKSAKWPKKFVEVPKVGSCVKAESGEILTVIRVTHCAFLVDSEPYIEIEVGKR